MGEFLVIVTKKSKILNTAICAFCAFGLAVVVLMVLDYEDDKHKSSKALED